MVLWKWIRILSIQYHGNQRTSGLGSVWSASASCSGMFWPQLQSQCPLHTSFSMLCPPSPLLNLLSQAQKPQPSIGRSFPLCSSQWPLTHHRANSHHIHKRKSCARAQRPTILSESNCQVENKRAAMIVSVLPPSLYDKLVLRGLWVKQHQKLPISDTGALSMQPEASAPDMYTPMPDREEGGYITQS